MSYHRQRGLAAVDAFGFLGDPSDPCPDFHVMRDGRCLTAQDLGFSPNAAQSIFDNLAQTNPSYQLSSDTKLGTRVANVAGASNVSATHAGAAPVVVSSNGVTPTPVSTASGFSLSAIPWWGWAAAGVGAFMFFGRGR